MSAKGDLGMEEFAVSNGGARSVPSQRSGGAGAMPRPGVLPVNKSGDGASKEARTLEAEEDRRLVLRAQKGDMAAFQKLVVRHQRRAFAVAVGMVRDENDARELVQDAFLRAHKALPAFQGESSFYTWFYRIVKNLAIDLKRKPGRANVEFSDEQLHEGEGAILEGAFGGGSLGDSPSDGVRRREMGERLRAAMADLAPQHREIILLREVEGASYEEMAAALGISQGTVMSRLFYARQKLQAALAEFYRKEILGADSTRVGQEGA